MRSILVAVAIACASVRLGAEEPKAQPPKEEPKAPAPKQEAKVAVSGFAQLDYRLGDSAGDQTAVEQEFNIRRARLTLSGKASDQVSYNVTFAGDLFVAGLIDAWVDWAVKPAAKIRLGQFKYDFDISGREADAATLFADRPWITNTVAGTLAGTGTPSVPGASSRDRGLNLYGTTKTGGIPWGYSVGLFQGSGLRSDNNDSLSYLLQLHLLPFEGLRVTSGFLSSDAANKGASSPFDYTAWTIGANYERGDLAMRSEFYHGKRDFGSTSQTAEGFYVHGVYTLSRLDLLARYEWMKDGQFAAGDDSLWGVDLGAKWYFVRQSRTQGTSLAVNYLIRNADDGFNKGMTLLNDGRGAALTSGAAVKNVLLVRVQVQY